MAEEIKQKLKMDELKKRFREVEGENDLLQEKLNRAHKSIKRLRLERSILLERIDKGFENGSDSDTNYDSLSQNDLTMNKISTQHHNHKQSKQAEKSSSTTSTTVIKPPKKKKDPNAPKGPGNVFFIFCRHERDKIKEENPEESIGDVTRLLGLKWKGLTREEKRVYYDMFKQEMDEYEEAMKVYKNNGGANGVLPLEEDDTPRSQSDPAEELAAGSVMSSPVSTNTENTMQQPHNEYLQDEHVFDRSSHHNYEADAHHHQPLYQSQPKDFISNNQENHLTQHHHQPRYPQPIQQQQQQLQQQTLQPAFIDNSNTLHKPTMPSHPPSAPYDHF
ncbi:HMG-box [Mucor ambiguus]|uniref:HMG-box n=1 Tax=Mucor ambiguus TaxID=91626 RepID=A0A0C9N5J2_9FUNG|nr:HMG-box [Mucor ambiguus]